jgi:AcrR family transcriptional regulator
VATKRGAGGTTKAEASAATTDLLLTATLKQLRRTGPVDFRIEDLVRDTGVSVGGIYHHFGDRAGLLRAAYIKVVEDVARHDAEVLALLVTSCTSVTEVVEGLRLLTRDTVSRKRMEAREMRIEAIALARRDPELRRRIVALQKETAEAHVDAFRELQRRGWMKANVDPYMFFQSMSGNTFGTIQDHLGPRALDPDKWADHTVELFSRFALETGGST